MGINENSEAFPEDSEEAFPGDVTINLKKIANETSLSVITRDLAKRLLISQYMTVEEYFTSLTDMDVEFLATMAKMNGDESYFMWYHAALELNLIASMLGWAEGTLCSSVNEDQTTTLFISFVILAALERRCIIKINWKNFTFDEDIVGRELYTVNPDQQKILDSFDFQILPPVIC